MTLQFIRKNGRHVNKAPERVCRQMALRECRKRRVRPPFLLRYLFRVTIREYLPAAHESTTDHAKDSLSNRLSTLLYDWQLA
jgi:hypothetical protein